GNSRLAPNNSPRQISLSCLRTSPPRGALRPTSTGQRRPVPTPDVRSVIFRRPEILVAAPDDFAPRGAMEPILHAHDVCLGLGVEFEPDSDLSHRLREHTRPWPMWTVAWHGLAPTDDPWQDPLI